MSTKISVVIPTRKRSRFLNNCLLALSKQTLSKDEFEVIVVSDGPDNDTLLALNYWFKRRLLNLIYLTTNERKGPAAARNIGWLTAKSKLIAFTDDDCVPHPDWLQSMWASFNGETLLAISGRIKVPLPKHPTDFDLNIAGLETAEFITANCACTKQALMVCGGFDERFKLAWREDSDLHFKLLELGIPILKAPEALVAHPVKPAPWGISIMEQKKAAYEALLFRKFPELYRRKIGNKFIYRYYIINLLWLSCIICFMMNWKSLLIFSAIVLALSLLSFTIKRLRNTSKSLGHVLEMVSTSVIIPSLSIFWRLYGSVKYRVLFI